MKTKATTHKSASTTPTNNPKPTTLASTNPQNYLHLLKESSSRYKNSKLVTLSKPEATVVGMRPTHHRGASTTKAEQLRNSKHKHSASQSFIEESARDQTHNKSVEFKSASRPSPSLTQRVPVSAKTNIDNAEKLRNNTTTRISKGDSRKPVTYDIFNRRPLSGSFCAGSMIKKPEDSLEKPGEAKKEENALSPSKQGYPTKHRSMANVELLTTTGSSNDKNREHAANSSVGGFNFDSQGSNGEERRKEGSAKREVPPITEFLDESFEGYKQSTCKSDESDSSAHEKCVNHPQKKAKYYIQHEKGLQNEYKLCSKCAVALADQGTKVKDLCNTQEEQRKAEIEAFLIKLSLSKRKNLGVTDSLHKKRENIEEYYLKQCEKADGVAATLERVIHEQLDEVKKSLNRQKTQFLSQISGVEEHLQAEVNETEEMRTDIERNVDSILKHIEPRPFQKIIGKYHSRLHEMDMELERILDQRVNLAKLPAIKTKHFDDLKTTLASFLELIPCKTSLIKRHEQSAEIKDSGRGPQSQSKKNNLCVSFENKQIFESAANSGAEGLREPDRFSFACDQSSIVQAWKQEEDDQDQLSHERASDKIEEMESSGRTMKLSGMRRGSGECSNLISTRRSKENYYFSADPHENSSRNSIVEQGRHSRHDSCPSIKSSLLTASALAVDPTPLRQEDSTTRDKETSSKKYISLLEKISNNQCKKTEEYSNLMKSNPLLHHQLNSDEEDMSEFARPSQSLMSYPNQSHTQSFVEERQEKHTQSMCGVKPGYNPFSSQRASKRYSKSHNNSLRYIADEFYVDEREESGQSSPYQSTYCSPNFKDNMDF